MLVTKEQQEALVENYIKNHNTYEYFGFVDGINATLKLITQISNRKQITKNK